MTGGPVRRRSALRWTLLGLALFAAFVVSLDLLRAPVLPLPPPPPAAQDDPGDDCPPPGASGGGREPLHVSSGALFTCPHSYDGRLVRYEGEAVGAILLRGDSAWVQVNDDRYALDAGPLPTHRNALGSNSGVAVHIASVVARQLGPAGGPGRRGPLLTVIGEFRSADPQDGGGPAITAQEVIRVVPSETFDEPVPPIRVAVTAGLAGVTVALGLMVALRRLRDGGRPWLGAL